MSLVHVSKLDHTELQHAFKCRAVAFRGTVAALEEMGLKTRVANAVPRETRSLMRRPPLAVRWMSALPLQHVLWALDGTTDDDRARELGRRATARTLLPFIASVSRRLIQASGRDPHSVFNAFTAGVRRCVRGIEFDYRSEGPDEGSMTIAYLYLEHVDQAAFRYWEGVLEVVAAVAGGRKAVVGSSEIVASDLGVARRIPLRW